MYVFMYDYLIINIINYLRTLSINDFRVIHEQIPRENSYYY